MPASKKNSHRLMTRSEVDADDFRTQVTSTLAAQDKILERLDEKVKSSHVLNGGFDTMMKKIDKIESVQEKLDERQKATSEKITAIHVAIYDPEQGIHTKVKGVIGWINNANWVIKGIFAAGGVGILSGAAKLFYDMITVHLVH